MQIEYGGRKRIIKKKVFAESKKNKNTVDSNNCLLPEGTWHIENI